MISRQSTSPQRIAKTSALAILTMAALGVSGCTPLLGGASTKFDRLGQGEAPVVVGPPVRDNFTPMNPALACLSEQITQANQPKLTIAVDDIKDYTGQYNINEGDAITQGGSLMVMSALGKLGGAVNVADRFNTDVTQMELSFMNQRELGDGTEHTVGSGPGQKSVPWIPYYGGTIAASKYYITGGITELNYNIQSAGVQFQVNNLGPSDRVYTEDIGIDLELVDTQTLLVVKSVSLVKQITGYQVGFNIFQFFGNNLYNLNIGNKSQEPAQLGVRTLLEEGVFRLVASAETLPAGPCLALAKDWIPKETAEDFLLADQTQAVQAASVSPSGAEANNTISGVAANASSTLATAGTLNATNAAAPLQNGNMEPSGGPTEIKFDYGASDVTGGDVAELDQAAAAVRQHKVQMVLLVPANEDWAPSKRNQLANARIVSVEKAMRIRGTTHFAIAWMPGALQNGLVMDGSGYQKVALLVVSQ